jgi:hypothetical protein
MATSVELFEDPSGSQYSLVHRISKRISTHYVQARTSYNEKSKNSREGNTKEKG